MRKKDRRYELIVFQPGDEALSPVGPRFGQLVFDQIVRSSRLGSPLSVRSYLASIRQFTTWFGAAHPGELITKSVVEEYLAQLKTLSGGKPSPAYLARGLAALRFYAERMVDLLNDNEDIKAMLSEAQRREATERLERVRLAKIARGRRAQGIEAGRYVPLEEFLALLDAARADGTRAGARDRAMLALAYALGPRVHEIARLTLADLRPVAGDEPAYAVRIIGKGDRQRPVTPTLTRGPALYLRDWLQVRGSRPGALFCFISQADRLVPSRMKKNLSTEALRLILLKRTAEAVPLLIERGLLDPSADYQLSWHDFRRTVASDMIEKQDIVVAQLALGHSSSAITSRYDRKAQTRVQAGLDLRFGDVPYEAMGADI